MKLGSYCILCTVQKKKKKKKNLQPFDQYYFKMETIFTSTENSKNTEPHSCRLSPADKLNLKNPNKKCRIS